MQKIQVLLDDGIAEELKEKAQSYGLTVSSYARLILNNVLKKKKLNALDQAMIEIQNGEVELLSLENFKVEIENLKNA